jgi:transposase InsO family protein
LAEGGIRESWTKKWPSLAAVKSLVVLTLLQPIDVLRFEGMKGCAEGKRGFQQPAELPPVTGSSRVGGCLLRCSSFRMHKVAIIDWYSRYVLAWNVSVTLDNAFCLEALDEAIRLYGSPEIFNSDQSCQFTSIELQTA